ncbi:hypothetical protein V1514DRAFT_324857 [Lipomyces japonicus]|uniref:uncharacterized protein n=1 Tax=Lipomyces japonicus TaxID=56871 RepID=UPI0034CD178F
MSFSVDSSAGSDDDLNLDVQHLDTVSSCDTVTRSAKKDYFDQSRLNEQFFQLAFDEIRHVSAAEDISQGLPKQASKKLETKSHRTRQQKPLNLKRHKVAKQSNKRGIKNCLIPVDYGVGLVFETAEFSERGFRRRFNSENVIKKGAADSETSKEEPVVQGNHNCEDGPNSISRSFRSFANFVNGLGPASSEDEGSYKEENSAPRDCTSDRNYGRQRRSKRQIILPQVDLGLVHEDSDKRASSTSSSKPFLNQANGHYSSSNNYSRCSESSAVQVLPEKNNIRGRQLGSSVNSRSLLKSQSRSRSRSQSTASSRPHYTANQISKSGSSVKKTSRISDKTLQLKCKIARIPNKLKHQLSSFDILARSTESVTTSGIAGLSLEKDTSSSGGFDSNGNTSLHHNSASSTVQDNNNNTENLVNQLVDKKDTLNQTANKSNGQSTGSLRHTFGQLRPALPHRRKSFRIRRDLQ